MCVFLYHHSFPSTETTENKKLSDSCFIIMFSEGARTGIQG